MWLFFFFPRGMHFSHSQGGKLGHCKTQESMGVAKPDKSSKLQRYGIHLRTPITSSWQCCSWRLALLWHWCWLLRTVVVAAWQSVRRLLSELIYSPILETVSLRFCILIVALAGSFTREAKNLSECGEWLSSSPGNIYSCFRHYL